MNVKRRIETLKCTLVFDPVTLHFAGGSSTQLVERGDYVMRLLGAVCRGEHSPKLDLISRSVSSEEPGGGHMLELIRAILYSPDEVHTNLSPYS